jgi:hypothetical protein
MGSMMNAELTAVGEQRIIIPTVYRDHLQALRALSRGVRADPIVRVADFAQAYAAALDWSDIDELESNSKPQAPSRSRTVQRG